MCFARLKKCSIYLFVPNAGFLLSLTRRDQGRLRIVTFLVLMWERKLKNFYRDTSIEFLQLLNPERDVNKLKTLSAPSKTSWPLMTVCSDRGTVMSWTTLHCAASLGMSAKHLWTLASIQFTLFYIQHMEYPLKCTDTDAVSI